MQHDSVLAWFNDVLSQAQPIDFTALVVACHLYPHRRRLHDELSILVVGDPTISVVFLSKNHEMQEGISLAWQHMLRVQRATCTSKLHSKALLPSSPTG